MKIPNDVWVFRFPPLIPQPRQLQSQDYTKKYPEKLLYWTTDVNILMRYDQNVFTVDQRIFYDVLFQFYGEKLLDDEIRIYTTLIAKPMDEYLQIVYNDYIQLQNELQGLMKLSSQLHYINSFERRLLFIKIQMNRKRITADDIANYEIPNFILFATFGSIYVTEQENHRFMICTQQFDIVIKKFNRIDPFGNLYTTKKLDMETMRILMKKFPNYNTYFSSRQKLHKIIASFVDDCAIIIKNLTVMKMLAEERRNFSHGLREDLLIKQERILRSRKPENLLNQINLKIAKLNSMIIKYNTSFILTNGQVTLNLKELTENFFYSDYISVRESVEGELKHKLQEILNILT